MRTSDFDFELPAKLIAQEPAPRRTDSRLMILDRERELIRHEVFSNIIHYLRPSDLVVLNRSRVIPARLFANRQTGARIEFLLTRDLGNDRWLAMARPSRKLEPGLVLTVEGADLQLILEGQREDGTWVLRFEGQGRVAEKVRTASQIALPPYIRNTTPPIDRYQTVYADREGSIAAPTAGLHFSNELLNKIQLAGIKTALVTLHVGPGTFAPVSAAHIEDHRMQSEWGEVSGEVADQINRGKSDGRRVVAVGTTTTRLLESAFGEGEVREFRGETDKFIRPGYAFKVVEALVTNFHLPRSTLLMLISAFAGYDFVFRAYAEAVEERYRFYSFGDAMFIT